MSSTMWKIALRTLARDKTYTVIDVAGLAIAIAKSPRSAQPR